MEILNLISSVILKLKLAYPSYFNKLTDEELIALAQMYKDELSSYNEKTLNIAIKNLIRTSKYMPSLNEIIQECDSNKTHNANTILERMKKDGYFKSANELDKAYTWLSKGIIPTWLKEDMKRYQTQLLPNETKLIEMSE